MSGMQSLSREVGYLIQGSEIPVSRFDVWFSRAAVIDMFARTPVLLAALKDIPDSFDSEVATPVPS
jgi:hypothetical protein